MNNLLIGLAMVWTGAAVPAIAQAPAIVLPVTAARAPAVVLPATAARAPAASQAPATAQVPAAASAVKPLVVIGDADRTLTLRPADLKTLPRTTVTVTAEDGTKAVYEGVLVGELLRRVGAPLGREMSGAAMTSYVLASASDGYQALFSLAELDPAFTANDIIVADMVDGKPLFDYQGPLRIVAPHDKRGARGVRMLERLELMRVRK